MTVLETKNLSFSYHPKYPVLQDVSLNLERGEFMGLIGPNGGGKTTFLKLILGILRPTSGTVNLLGKDPRKKDVRLEIGYVPQMPDIPRDFPATVKDVISMGVYGRLKFKFSRTIKKQYKYEQDQILDLLGLLKLANRPIGELSGGQFRKVLLGRALIGSPKILILDEPTAGIDSSGEVRFFSFIKELRKATKVTLLMSSHNIDTLKVQADRITCINKTLHCCESASLVSDQLVKHIYECELETFYHNQLFHLLKSGCDYDETSGDT